ncbi:hypothetical protein [Clostridium fungisolvens]|uniref:Uncharacterized protein n=1 Tax=Clostridium fungisolvens TaxID=1604897 RepID=A0A6V8SFA8_9CLOT|nr:hypothetical protein [Clostridium fungisolvens]GFP75396.1 hypothetical protein bsdtw1_01476 [Clostridium fungisolvens]
MKTKKRRRVKRRNKVRIIRQKVGVDNIVQLYNIFGIIIGLWALFYPNPFRLVISLSMLAASIGFIILFIYKSVEFLVQDGSSPFVGLTIALNSMAIFMSTTFGSNTIYSALLWIYFALSCFILTTIMIFLKKIKLRNIDALFFIIFSIPAYCMGTILNVNFLYDYSEPSFYTTTIIGKDIYESGEKLHVVVHRVGVSPWGPIKSKNTVVVPDKVYYEVSDNEIVYVCLKKGLLGINWYYLDI